ncbi:MAG: L-threonylcarbamoyladenylate synthase [Patescibacteria group bacterium]|nr:L-threonylcarbamoyladenylate synthase [Patescibacteria group bacterium]
MMYKKEIKILKNCGIGIMPTDTIYGLVGRALSQRAVKRVYEVRKRDLNKPFIILISSLADLRLFGIELNKRTSGLLKKIWPGPVSVILPCPHKKFSYLHRGTNSLAFRLPKLKWLRDLLKQTGPLVAPSANLSGKLPAKNIKEAKKYFGSKADFYIDFGEIESPPSSLIEIKR